LLGRLGDRRQCHQPHAEIVAECHHRGEAASIEVTEIDHQHVGARALRLGSRREHARDRPDHHERSAPAERGHELATHRLMCAQDHHADGVGNRRHVCSRGTNVRRSPELGSGYILTHSRR
jgi:hypothetical protein